MERAILKGLTVVDLGSGMPPALITKFFADCGATVIRIEPAGGDACIDFWPSPRAGGEWAKPGPIEGEGDHPICTRAQRREDWGYPLDRQAERSRGDGLALAQRGAAPHTR